MNPELSKRLMELPEGRELLSEIQRIALNLDSISDIKENLDDPIELSIELKARKRAVEIIVKEILSSLSSFGPKKEEIGEDESEDAGV